MKFWVLELTRSALHSLVQGVSASALLTFGTSKLFVIGTVLRITQYLRTCWPPPTKHHSTCCDNWNISRLCQNNLSSHEPPFQESTNRPPHKICETRFSVIFYNIAWAFSFSIFPEHPTLYLLKDLLYI